jgi:hypothetical protein
VKERLGTALTGKLERKAMETLLKKYINILLDMGKHEGQE